MSLHGGYVYAAPMVLHREPRIVIERAPQQWPWPQPDTAPALASTIETLDETCKDDAELFRELVMKLVKKELGT